MTEAAKLHIEMIGGFCPVQAEGTIDGKPFYFRARGFRWELEIETSQGDGSPWSASCTWGEWPDAGWMPEDEARRLIEWCAKEYAKSHQIAPVAAETVSEATPATPEQETGLQPQENGLTRDPILERG